MNFKDLTMGQKIVLFLSAIVLFIITINVSFCFKQYQAHGQIAQLFEPIYQVVGVLMATALLLLVFQREKTE